MQGTFNCLRRRQSCMPSCGSQHVLAACSYEDHVGPCLLWLSGDFQQQRTAFSVTLETGVASSLSLHQILSACKALIRFTDSCCHTSVDLYQVHMHVPCLYAVCTASEQGQAPVQALQDWRKSCSHRHTSSNARMLLRQEYFCCLQGCTCYNTYTFQKVNEQQIFTGVFVVRAGKNSEKAILPWPVLQCFGVASLHTCMKSKSQYV